MHRVNFTRVLALSVLRSVQVLELNPGAAEEIEEYHDPSANAGAVTAADAMTTPATILVLILFPRFHEPIS